MKCPWCNGAGEFGGWPSEGAKYLHLVEEYMRPPKSVVDVGSGGWPIVPQAIQIELDWERFCAYTSHQDRPPIQYFGDGANLPFRDGVIDVLFSSHLIEDIAQEHTPDVLREWSRVVKPNGVLIIMHPDRDVWNYCIQHLRQPPNCQHRAERKAGELGKIGEQLGLRVIKDEMTNLWEFDYNILTVFSKP